MCGRTFMSLSPDEIIQNLQSQHQFQINEWIQREQYRPRFNVAPSTYQPILRTLNQLQTMKWGLVPSWSKDGKAITINTRDDSLFPKTKPLYRSVLKQRGLLLCQGFYEWRDKEKQPYLFHPFHPEAEHPQQSKDIENWIQQPLLLMAAFFSEWHQEFTFTIITAEAANYPQLTDSIHHRMPVLLWNRKMIEDWLNPDLELKQVEIIIQSALNHVQLFFEPKPFDQEQLKEIKEVEKEKKNIKKEQKPDMLVIWMRPVTQKVNKNSYHEKEAVSYLLEEESDIETPAKKKRKIIDDEKTPKITSFFKRKA